MRDNVDICVATYKRPELLSQLLRSLGRQTARATSRVRIIVVDNDARGSAREAVANFRLASGMDVIYDVEPIQGISYARNRAVKHVAADFLAFIDDDELASPDWLETIMAALKRHDADVVFGPVLGVLPESAPAWARAHPSFKRSRLRTGTIVSLGATGNVLLRSRVLKDGNPFSGRYARTGGEDTELFSRLHFSGAKLVWCDEAIVSEHVLQQRLTIGWVSRRAFRGGQTYFRIFVAERSRFMQLVWLGKRLAAVIGAMLVAPFIALLGPGILVAHLTRMCGWLGQLSQGFVPRFLFEEYRGEGI